MLVRICSSAPGDAETWLLLGSTNGRLRDSGGAERCFREAIKAREDFPAAHYNLGIALREQGLLDEAQAALRRATELKPDYADAWNSLGFVLFAQTDRIGGTEAFRKVCELAPLADQAYANLANAYVTLGKHTEALTCFQKAISLNGREGGYYGNLANILCNQGRLDEAVEAYHRSTVLAPRDAALHSNYLLTLHYIPGMDPQRIFDEHLRWARSHEPPMGTPAFANVRDPDRALRVGYISPDFREHSVTYFFEPLLAHHDGSSVETFCYSSVPRPDSTTTRLESITRHWRPIAGKSGEDILRLVRSDHIDILVDLSGHTACGNLGVFAHRAAPVQVTYLGYPGTTGMKNMDYRLTDDLADPPGTTEQYYTERLSRLPTGFLCYQAPRLAPAPSPPPWKHTGYVTFGSFNNLSKVNDTVIALWSRILLAVPGARLILKYHCLSDAATRALVFERFRRCGIAEERLDLVGATPTTVEHLEIYSRVDIALDPFPYNGTTTTCEALWMGVPVITLAGATHAHRVGVSLLTRAGYRDFIAGSEQAYADIALSLARDHEKRARLRTELRETVKHSSLCDATAIAASVEAAYRSMWREWCGKRSS